MLTSENKTIQSSDTSNRNVPGKAPFFQPKLTINAPGDEYEQEADAMADKVMRMPMNDQPFFSAKPVGISHLQRKCAHCEEEEKLQRKENTTQPTEAGSETSSYIHSLSSKGSPLSKETRSFFEPRFGYDFSDVKVHTDAVAAKSAHGINALAYTSGNNIVFNENQFSPESDSGKKLLAHELMHVVQQGASKSFQKIFRSVNYNKPAFTTTNAVSTLINGGSVALTTPTVNGSRLPDDFKKAGEIIFKAFKLDNNTASIKPKGKNNVCSYDEPVVNISADISIIDAPSGSAWNGYTDANNFSTSIADCKNKGNVPVEITGNPDAGSVYKKIKNNEMEHYDDLVATGKKHLQPLLTLLKSFSDTTVTNNSDCQTKFVSFIKNRDGAIIADFLKELSDKKNKRDTKPGPHWLKRPHLSIDPGCAKIYIVESY